MFPSALGVPQDGSNLLAGQFHPLLAAAGLPRIRFHDLRHTAATLMLGRGVHVTPTMQREAARAMDEALT